MTACCIAACWHVASRHPATLYVARRPTPHHIASPISRLPRMHATRRGPRTRIRVSADTHSYVPLIDSCARRGDARLASAWLDEMVAQGLRPTPRVCSESTSPTSHTPGIPADPTAASCTFGALPGAVGSPERAPGQGTRGDETAASQARDEREVKRKPRPRPTFRPRGSQGRLGAPRSVGRPRSSSGAPSSGAPSLPSRVSRVRLPQAGSGRVHLRHQQLREDVRRGRGARGLPEHGGVRSQGTADPPWHGFLPLHGRGRLKRFCLFRVSRATLAHCS